MGSDARPRRRRDEFAATFATISVLICALLIVGTYGLLVVSVSTRAFSSVGITWVTILTNVGVMCFLYYRASRTNLSQFDRALLLIDPASSAYRLRYGLLLTSGVIVVLMQLLLLFLYSGMGGSDRKLDIGFAALIPLLTAKAILILVWTRKLYLAHGARYRFSTIFSMMFGPQSKDDMDESLWKDFQLIQERNRLSNTLIVMSAIGMMIIGALMKKMGI